MSWYSTTEERKDKYNFARNAGLPTYMCRRLRDWRWTTLHGAVDIYHAVFIKKDPTILKDFSEYITHDLPLK